MKKTSIKNILVWMAAALIIFTLTAAAGCSEKEAASVTEAEWSIKIKTNDGKTIKYTNEDAGAIDMLAVDAVLKKKDGSTIDQNWKGIPLAEVLKSAGIQDYNRIAIEASDGYSREYEASAIDDPETILGLFLDGKEVSTDEGLVQLVVPSLAGMFWIRNVAVIEVLE
jgi:DMSO/TMAO reductase YedYZ molybdopterin-dependent catalytic subunit